MNRLIKVCRLLALGVLLCFLYGCKTQSTLPGSTSQLPSSSSSSSSPVANGASPTKTSAGAHTPGEQGESDDGSAGDETLSEALDAFERARGESADMASEPPITPEEEFPILLPDAAKVQGQDFEAGGSGDELGALSEPPAGSISTDGARTTDEKISVLDRRLEESYGSFDGMILREREHVRHQENERGSDVDEGDFSAEYGANSGVEAREPAPPGSEVGYRPESQVQREGEFEQATAANLPPADIPDGSDDDVLARQLREAATQEPDPELREKLWDEYRKYKNKSKD